MIRFLIFLTMQMASLLVYLIRLLGAAVVGLLIWLFRRRPHSHSGSETRWTAARLPLKPLAPVASVEDQVDGFWPWER